MKLKYIKYINHRLIWLCKLFFSVRIVDEWNSLPTTLLSHLLVFVIQTRFRNDLYCVEWDVKLYYTYIHTHILCRPDILLSSAVASRCTSSGAAFHNPIPLLCLRSDTRQCRIH